jgi:hypothetical protein
MIERTEAADRTEATLKKLPTEKSDPAEPMEPIESTDPIELIDRTEPFELMDRTEPFDRRDRVEEPRALDTAPSWRIGERGRSDRALDCSGSAGCSLAKIDQGRGRIVVTARRPTQGQLLFGDPVLGPDMAGVAYGRRARSRRS